MTLRDLLDGLTQRAHAGAAWVLGRDRKDRLDRWFAQTYDQQPLLFGLVVTWLAFCAVPVAAFLGYAALWAFFAFGVFWAIFLFWAGVGLLFLVPALFVATGLAVVVFAWAAVTFTVAVRVLALLGYERPYFGSSSSAETKSTGANSGYLPPATKTQSIKRRDIPATEINGGGGKLAGQTPLSPPHTPALAPPSSFAVNGSSGTDGMPVPSAK